METLKIVGLILVAAIAPIVAPVVVAIAAAIIAPIALIGAITVELFDMDR